VQSATGFDRWAPSYEASPLQRWLFGRAHEAVLRVVERFPTPTAVLDVGCGTGRLLRLLRRQWPKVNLVGVDPAPGMIAIAQRLMPDAQFVVSRAEELPFAHAVFDIAVTTISFHHWTDRRAGLHEVLRVLRPGGHFILVDLAGPLWLSRLLGDPPYARRREREVLLRDTPCRVVEHVSIGPPYLLLTVAVVENGVNRRPNRA
jgi:ubiquinone/menaquinone biosynthesis C-methylase UbiE